MALVSSVVAKATRSTAPSPLSDDMVRAVSANVSAVDASDAAWAPISVISVRRSPIAVRNWFATVVMSSSPSSAGLSSVRSPVLSAVARRRILVTGTTVVRTSNGMDSTASVIAIASATHTQRRPAETRSRPWLSTWSNNWVETVTTRSMPARCSW